MCCCWCVTVTRFSFFLKRISHSFLFKEKKFLCVLLWFPPFFFATDSSREIHAVCVTWPSMAVWLVKLSWLVLELQPTYISSFFFYSRLRSCILFPFGKCVCVHNMYEKRKKRKTPFFGSSPSSLDCCSLPSSGDWITFWTAFYFSFVRLASGFGRRRRLGWMV